MSVLNLESLSVVQLEEWKDNLEDWLQLPASKLVHQHIEGLLSQSLRLLEAESNPTEVVRLQGQVKAYRKALVSGSELLQHLQNLTLNTEK